MIISIVNHKGGTGKTTTSINLGSALTAEGYRVLLVDFDAQGSLSYSLGIDDSQATIAEVLLEEVQIDEVIQTRESIDVIPAFSSLADVELAIAKADEQYSHLKNALDGLTEYDFILIDCSPSLSLLTLNALTASDFVIIPMQMDVLALRGLDSMLETIKKVNHINSGLSVLGILIVMADRRRNMYQEIQNHIKSNYAIRLFNQTIRTNVKAAEAPSHGKSVVSYAPTSSTAMDYRSLANEIIGLAKQPHHSSAQMAES
jgi:chromosome partitioning protein